MNPTGTERLFDLLADRAGAELLTPEQARELDRLLVANPDVDPGAFDRAAAAVHLALMPQELAPMPAALRTRIQDAASSFFSIPPPAVESAAPEPIRFASWLGWLTAAAAILFLFLQSPGTAGRTYEEVLNAPDVVVARWTGTEDPAAADVAGSVAWSDDLQAGYMLFEGLPANDPGEGQYQLWIFDPERPVEHPVDGGVFDSSGGSTRVAIDAKLAVLEPSLFAVTYERPGGVVVSTRERLVLTAAPE